MWVDWTKVGVLDLIFAVAAIATLPHRWVMIGRGIVLGNIWQLRPSV
jgi:hypothetical protein